MIITVFDTETTGLPEKGRKTKQDSSKWPYIVQLSYILYVFRYLLFGNLIKTFPICFGKVFLYT